jgi:hypothetical protein
MRYSIVHLTLFALCLCLGAAPAAAQDEPVAQDKIPKAVMDALFVKFPKPKIETCTKTTEGGEVVYDIEFTQDGRKCEADITEKGVYINYEKAIAARRLPQAVRAAVEKRYPKSTLKEIMEETEVKGKEERLSAYEVVLVTGNKKDVEVRLSPDGKVLEEAAAEKPKRKN